MNLKSILIAAIAITALASCSKDDTGNNSGETSRVQLKINTGTAVSRADALPVSDGATLTFNDGYLYFVDGGNGQITNRVAIIKTAGDNETTVNIDDLDNGVALENIKSNATKVYFVGNIPSSVSLPSAGHISIVLEKTATVIDQSDAAGSVSSVSLYGNGPIRDGALPTDNRIAELDVYPIVARLQIPEVIADGVVTGFQLDGIFVNNFYHEVQLDGTPVATNFVSYVSNDDFSAGGETYYGVSYDKITYDYNASGLGGFASGSYTPSTAGNVWAYNVFANSAVPTVVLKFSGITTSDNSTYADPQYVTIKGIRNSGTLLPELVGGKIYTFDGTIKINEDNITSVPEVEPIDVEVTVTLMDWEEFKVTPEY